MPTAIQFARREDLWDYAWSKKNPRGFIAEFGVWNGYSINRLAAKETQIIYGFDSFAGLNEEWTGAAPKGEFDRRGVIPKVASNVRLIKGWFHESLPPFLSAHEGPFAFTHIDCDTYEATDVVLKSLDSRLQDGAIIVFDDYFGYRGWRHGEYRAFQDFVRQQKLGYEYLGYASNQVAVRISGSANGERPCPRRGGTNKT